MNTLTYPKSTDYQLAIQNPQVVFRDPELVAARVEKSPLGQPVIRGGSFAVTFHLTHGTSDWAVRCFKRELGELQHRYTKISDALRRANLSCFARFEYQSDGILVEGRRWPIVKMAWVPGVTLGAYVERHYRDAKRMRVLAQHFRETMKLLDHAGIAHGDLQHANIMASDTGITLIDYDGMYVPSIGLTHSNEIGHVNYQSPLRTGNDYDAAMDRFSAIVIMLTLHALERDAALWDRHWQGGEKLLFERPDFLDPDSSPLMRDLIAIPDLRDETQRLQRLCRTPLDKIPSLESFLAGVRVSSDATVALPLTSVRIRQYDVLRATGRDAILARVGDRIEIVGQVTAIKKGTTRYGKPYAFINFGDWRTGAFRIVLWSESLERFASRGMEVASFAGRWISITGLVEEYRGSRHSPQIVLNDPSDLQMLNGEAEAKRIYDDGQGAPPLGRPSTQKPTTTSNRNAEIRTALRQNSGNRPTAATNSAHRSLPAPSPVVPIPPNPATRRTNDAVRQNIRSLSSPPADTSSVPSSLSPPYSSPPSVYTAPQSATPQQTHQRRPSRGTLFIILWVVAAVIICAVLLVASSVTR